MNSKIDSKSFLSYIRAYNATLSRSSMVSAGRVSNIVVTAPVVRNWLFQLMDRPIDRVVQRAILLHQKLIAKPAQFEVSPSYGE